jgi:hypothetical protein
MASYTPFLSESYLNIFHSFQSSLYLFSLTLARNSQKKKKKKKKERKKEEKVLLRSVLSMGISISFIQLLHLLKTELGKQSAIFF